MNEIRQAAYRIRHYFHIEPERLTLRRFFDLAGDGAAYIRTLTSKPPPAEAPKHTEHF